MKQEKSFATTMRGLLVVSLAFLALAFARAQTTTFTYQGLLTDSSIPATGTYDFQFALYDALAGGAQQPQPSPITVTRPAVSVTNGIFTVQLDFGGSVFPGADRYLEIAVKKPADSSYTPLTPRQQLASTPYAMHAGTATNADNAANATNATNATTATNFEGDLSGDVTGTQSATIVSSVGGQTATNVAGATVATNNAASTSIANTIVKRDGTGNFSAGTITGNLSGNATTATNFNGSLSGDVTGTQSATVVTAVGGKTSTQVAGSVTDTTNATSANTAGTIVKRDASGNFAGNLSGSATSATNFSGNLSGDVTGTQSATVVGKLQGRTVASTAPASAQVLKFDGTQWAPGSDNDTTYSAGSGLTLSGTTFNATFGGDGSATTLSRSDHTHTGQTWTSGPHNDYWLSDLSGSQTLHLRNSDKDVNSAALYAEIFEETQSQKGPAIWGVSYSYDPTSSGVFGQALGGGVNYPEGPKGVRGEATGAYATGIYGRGYSGAYAGQFIGDVQIIGNVFKSGGSFKIDHPLDPANKYLYHSFVESPDMMNVYNGNITTDANGDATVTLPAYFEALNRDFRYQLTVIGAFAQAMVAEEIGDNQFKIKTDKPNVKVSWQVTGIRQDKFAEDHRIPTEEDKKETEKGICLYAPACGGN